ncbi:hypothetical protein AAP_01565 [Ascosphaera apis ARSEF 7405]|uniref:Uncharacterized protein n=1 Tax=Ascosphaera apis ARSEF 7405 TaxID=392613 RepID=A0A168BBK9_9EURO|nr:hypothetical protein AAP_01565 [Ascosphaera apis ARSEF 7405]
MSAAFSLTHELSLLVHFLSCHPNFRRERTVPTETHCYPIPWAYNAELALTQNIAEILARRPGGRTWAVSCFELPEGLTIFVAGDVSPNVDSQSSNENQQDEEDDQGARELNETMEYLSTVVKKLKNIAAKNKALDGMEIKEGRAPVRQAYFRHEPTRLGGARPGYFDPSMPHDTFRSRVDDIAFDRPADHLNGYGSRLRLRGTQEDHTEDRALHKHVERVFPLIEAEMRKSRGPPEELELFRYVLRTCRAKILHRWKKYFSTVDEFFQKMRTYAELYYQSGQGHQSGQGNTRANRSRASNTSAPPEVPANPFSLIKNLGERKAMIVICLWLKEHGHKFDDPTFLDKCITAPDPPDEDDAEATNSSSSDESSDAGFYGGFCALLYVASTWPTHPETLADIDNLTQAMHVATPNGMAMSRVFKKFFSQFKAVEDFLWAAERRKFYTEVLNRPIVIKGVRVLPPTDCGAEMRRVLPTNPEAWRTLLYEWLGRIPVEDFERVRGVNVEELINTAANRAALGKLPPGTGFVCAELQLLTYFLYTGEGIGRILSRWGIDWDHLMSEGPPIPKVLIGDVSPGISAADLATATVSSMEATQEANSEIESWKNKRVPFAISKSTSCQPCRMVIAWAEHKKRQDGEGLGNMFKSAKVLVFHRHINTTTGQPDNNAPPENNSVQTRRYMIMVPPTDGRFVSGGTRWAVWPSPNKKDGDTDQEHSELGYYRVPKGSLWMLPWGLEEKLGEERILRIVQELILMVRGECRERGQQDPPGHRDAVIQTSRTGERLGAGQAMAPDEFRRKIERRREVEDAIIIGPEIEAEMEGVEAPVPVVFESEEQQDGAGQEESDGR